MKQGRSNNVEIFTFKKVTKNNKEPKILRFYKIPTAKRI